MHGVVARRRVIHYGWKYLFDGRRLAPGSEPPGFLPPATSRRVQATVLEELRTGFSTSCDRSQSARV